MGLLGGIGGGQLLGMLVPALSGMGTAGANPGTTTGGAWALEPSSGQLGWKRRGRRNSDWHRGPDQAENGWSPQPPDSAGDLVAAKFRIVEVRPRSSRHPKHLSEKFAQLWQELALRLGISRSQGYTAKP